MKIKRNKRSKKYLIATIVVVFLVLAGSSAWVYYKYFYKADAGTNKTADDSSINQSEPSEEQKTAAAEIKESSIESSKNSESETDKSENVDMLITRSDYDSKKSILSVGVLIEAITSSGTCELTLSNGSETINKSVGLQALSSNSTCKGFEVEAVSPGSWTIEVSLSGSDYSGATSKKLELKG